VTETATAVDVPKDRAVRRAGCLGVIALAQLMVVLDATIVTISLAVRTT